MALRYYEALKALNEPTPKDSYKADYDAIVDMTFDNAYNIAYNEIEYEKTYGENDFELIDRVRVDVILDYNTGIILSDDYKTFIFDTKFPIIPYYGMKFRWKGSYWLVINTCNDETLPITAEVRRCNNVLRFFDEKGNRISEPCILDYTLRFANDSTTGAITIGKGEQKVWCQRNKRTELIKVNDRFLFGTPKQRVCYRVYGGGFKNYMNSITEDDNSYTISEIYIGHYQVNKDFDDLVNGYANAYFRELRIDLSDVATTLAIGTETTLKAQVYKGQQLLDTEVTWQTDDDTILKINGNKLVAEKVGKTNLIATLVDNNDVSATVSVEVLERPLDNHYDILISPTDLYVLQGQSRTFTVSLTNNGELVESFVTIRNTTTNVPLSCYEITGGKDNTFTIVNKKMYMESPLLVECSANGYTETFAIYLRGLF